MNGTDSPRVGDLVIVRPLFRVVDLPDLAGVPGATVRDSDGIEAWVPLAWLLLAQPPNGGT